LFEAFSNQPGLVLFNGTINMSLDLENPLIVNDIGTRLRWNQTPCIILEKSLLFLIHRSTAMRNTHGSVKMSRFDNGSASTCAK
jgi:hypothetical protein